MIAKRYLGDSVYAEEENGMVKLTRFIDDMLKVEKLTEEIE